MLRLFLSYLGHMAIAERARNKRNALVRSHIFPRSRLAVVPPEEKAGSHVARVDVQRPRPPGASNIRVLPSRSFFPLRFSLGSDVIPRSRGSLESYFYSRILHTLV